MITGMVDSVARPERTVLPMRVWRAPITTHLDEVAERGPAYFRIRLTNGSPKGGTCQPCGGMGKTCCGNNICDAGLGCNNPSGSTSEGTCMACGAIGSACCPGSNCQAGGRCEGSVNRMGGTCQPCGGMGMACCPGLSTNTCVAGFACLKEAN